MKRNCIVLFGVSLYFADVKNEESRIKIQYDEIFVQLEGYKLRPSKTVLIVRIK